MTNRELLARMNDYDLGQWLCHKLGLECHRCPGESRCGTGSSGLVQWLKEVADPEDGEE